VVRVVKPATCPDPGPHVGDGPGATAGGCGGTRGVAASGPSGLTAAVSIDRAASTRGAARKI